jgi:hypothetical protein
MGKTGVSEIIKDTWKAIRYVLRDEYLPSPTSEIWIYIDENCTNRWNFLYCIWCSMVTTVKSNALPEVVQSFMITNVFFSQSFYMQLLTAIAG